MQPLRLPATFLALSVAEFTPTPEQLAALGPPQEFDAVGDGLGADGNRFEVVAKRSRKLAERVAANFDEEPRHKNVYFVEEIAPKLK